MDDRLIVEQDGPLLRVTLNDPDRRNAQTPRMWQALADIGSALAPEIRVVIVRGAGQSFSAGLDRRMLGPGVPGETPLGAVIASGDAGIAAFIERAQCAFTWQRECQAITIAAVQGHAIGAGAQLMLACDLAVAGDDLQFALREVSLGLIPDLGGTGPLVARVGYHRALDLCATGRFVGADEGVAIGLVDRVAPAAGLWAAADALAAELLAAPEAAVRALKPLLRGAELDHQAQRAREQAAQIPLLQQLGRAT